MNQELYTVYKKTVTWIGDIYMATEPPLCKAEQIEKMLEIIEPGDIICRGYNYYLDSYLIPGDYSHSGLVISKNKMIHAIAEGVQFIHPIDFVKDVDRFIILRPKYTSPENINKVIDKALLYEHEKMEYDFLFNEDGKLYCHECTAACLFEGDINVSKTVKSFGILIFKFTRELYLAQNLIDISNIKYEFNPKKDK